MSFKVKILEVFHVCVDFIYGVCLHRFFNFVGLSQCWGWEDRESAGHRPGTGAGQEGGEGRHSIRCLFSQETENEDGPESGEPPTLCGAPR